MKPDKQIIKEFYGTNGRKNLSESGLRKQKQEDVINRAFFAGDKSQIYKELSHEGIKFTISFNRVKPFVHGFAGFAAQNRRTSEFFAVEKDDTVRASATEAANQFYNVLRSNANADQVETKQDIELAICGYGVVMPYIDYTESPDGLLKYVECTEDYYWDPSARQAGLQDRRYEYVRKVMSAQDAVDMYGGSEEDYQLISDPDKSQYEYFPNGGTYNKIAYDWVQDASENKVYVYEYHWYELEKYYIVENPIHEEENKLNGKSSVLLNSLNLAIQKRIEEDEHEAGDWYNFKPEAKSLIMNSSQFKDFSAICKLLDIELEYEENKRKVYYEAILSGSKVFQKRKAIGQSGFACRVKTADYYRDGRIWQGIVSSLREPAKYANKAITEFMMILAATSKPGVIYDISKVKDVTTFEANYAKNARAIGVIGNPNDVVSNKQQPAMPNGYEQMAQIAIAALAETTGFAPEAMGMGDLSQPSFELEQQRIKQVMTTLAVYFDSITLFQLESARGDLWYMRRLVKNREGRIIPVMDAGQRKISEIYSDMLSDEYSVDIGEAPDTPTRKKEQTIIMSQFADKIAMTAPQKALDVYSLMIDYMPISNRDKIKWKEVFAPAEPDPAAAQEAMEAAQIQKEGAITDIERKRAEVEYKLAQAAKTNAEISKVEAEADKANLEVVTMSSVPINQLNVTI